MQVVQAVGSKVALGVRRGPRQRSRLVVVGRKRPRAALRNAEQHLLAVIVKVLDDRLGLQEGVARHRQDPMGVHVHFRRELGPPAAGLGADRDLQEALQQSGVVDARAEALVVLGVANDQPGPGPSTAALGATTAKSGFTSVARASSKPTNGTASS